MKTLTISTVTLAQATGTLTSNNTNVSDGDTVTIGTTTYTFKSALTPTAGQVLIGADADASLLNLIRAINHSGTPGTDYANLGVTAVANTQVTAASSVTAHAFAVTAIVRGIAGNAIATTDTAATLSWGATTLAGGQAVSLTGTVADTTYAQAAQRVTVEDTITGNPNWSRAVEVTDQVVKFKRNGATAAAIALPDSLAKVAIALEPTLTFAPRITVQPEDVATAAGGSLEVSLTAVSETAKTYAWWVNAKATGLLTSSGVNVSDGNTVTVGAVTYTFKTTLTPTAGQVLIGADADASLLNLARAINHTGTPGTDYANLGATAVAHPTVCAYETITSHILTVTALAVGTGGNALASTVSAATLSWGGATLSGGGWAAVTGADVNFVSLTAETTASLSIITPATSAEADGMQFRCVVSNASGSTTSDEVTMTVT